MSSHERLPEELTAFERALSDLAPAPSRIDRDRLMYELGAQAATEKLTAIYIAKQRRWFTPKRVWAAASVMLACTSLGLAVRLAMEMRTVTHETLAVETRDTVSAESASTSETSPGVSSSPAVVNARRAANERWLMALASPDVRGDDTLRLRPHPLVMAGASTSPAPITSRPDDDVESSTGPLRWRDRQQWQDWLDTIN